MAFTQCDVEFTRDGAVFDQAQADAAVAQAAGLTDMFVLAHGWNNNREEAAALYDALVGNMETLLDIDMPPGLAERRFGVVRIFWPSKRFEDADLIPAGGVAAMEPERDTTALLDILENMKRNPVRLGGDEPDPERVAIIDKAKALVPHLEADPAARRDFVLHLRSLVDDPSQRQADDGSAAFFAEDPHELFERLSKPVGAPVGPSARSGASDVGRTGGAAGLQDLFSGVISAARRLANYTTYCDMKQRAGIVGSKGVAGLLQNLREKNRTLRLHLVGHSFGGRLVTAAANALPPNTNGITLSLLQAAYSHNGLSVKFDGEHDGAFRRLLSEKCASGPIIITHTKNDQAVGIAYPLASRITRDQAADLGDQNDPYGGMGRNGAQHTPEVNGASNTLLEVGKAYAFAPGSVYNLRADDFIHSHGEVTGQQVAYAILNAVHSV